MVNDISPTARGLRVLVAHPGAELYGSDRVLLESVTGLIEAGASVTVSLPTDGPLVPVLRSAGAEVVTTRTVVLRKSLLSPAGVFKLAGGSIAGSVAGLRLIRRVRPDVIYVNTVTIPLWTYLGRLRRVPVVAHVHEAESSARPWVARTLVAPIRRAKAIVANSEYSLAVLGATDPALAARGIVIYNGVPGPDQVEHPRPALDGAVRLLYVGRLSERKGVDVLVEALALIRAAGIDAHLDVVGAVFPGYEWFEQKLDQLVTDLGLGDAVTFHGFQDSVWPFLRDADIAVVPSTIDEPFGNTAVEAVLAARPVVVSETSGLKEAARGYRSARFVPPADPQAIADAVAGLVGDWATVREDAWLDRETALRRHDPLRYRALVADVVAAVAAGEHAPARDVNAMTV
jgi:glycosyltransferase involved in cell wall biosynthesis